MIFIISKTNARLCQDGLWRSHANLGDMSSCVQEYRYIANAHKRARRVKGRVVHIPNGHSIDSSGEIRNIITDKVHTFEEFIVPTPEIMEPAISSRRFDRESLTDYEST